MHTPSLHRRVVTTGVGAVVLLAVALDLLIFFSWRANLLGTLDAELAAREQLIRSEAVVLDAQDLAARLDRIGLGATIRDRSGRSYEVGPRPQVGAATMVREIMLPRGMTATVAVATTDADTSLRTLLIVEVIGTVVAATLAFFLLRLVSELALQPLGQMTAAIRRTAQGNRGERLRPDQPHTGLGEVARAYDDMLDALEAALGEAAAARDRSQRLQERAQKIVDTANDAFVAADAGGSITGWNRRAEAVFGWSASEALGRSLADTVIPLESREAHNAGVDRYLTTGESRILGRPVELLALHRQGHLFPVELTVWTTHDDGAISFNAFVRDVSERRKAEEEQSRLASIVASSDEAIVGMDLDHRIMTWNGAAQRICGYSAEEAVGQPMLFVVPPDRRAEVGAMLERLASGHKIAPHETTWLRKDGTVIEVALTVSTICDRSGRRIGASVIARDITEQRQMRAALDATLADLSAALAEAQASEARTRRFLADAAHQLRTPVAGIQACAETLLLDADPADADELLANLVQETARAGRLIKALLQTARLDQGMVVGPRPCDLVALCEAELERARSFAPGLTMTLARSEWEGGWVQLDADVVREIVANLLDNARRHARSAIELKLVSAEPVVEVRVTDDGPGLAPDLSERAFERFVSLDGKGGTGLGLPIARGLAEVHGGTLRYEGGSFVLRLPAPRTPVDGDHQPGQRELAQVSKRR